MLGAYLDFGFWMLVLFITTSITNSAERPPKFLGAQSCASAMCHGGADEKHNQFLIWSKKDFHTRAPATLAMARSARIADTLKINNAATDARCTVCHNPFQAVPTERKGPLVGKLEGVSCESCHNAAEPWLLTHTRPDLTHEQKVAVGLRDLKNLYVRANTCVACHQNLEPEVRAAGHPELIFELDGQCASMPRHWRETNSLRGSQAWLIGQAAALREAAAHATTRNASGETKARAAALEWLVGSPVAVPSADQHAREVAAWQWKEEDVVARLTKLAGSSEAFLRSDVSKDEQTHRAERLVMAVERALVALKLDKDPVFTSKLDRLFKDIQSRPDFEPKVFAEHLKEFDSEWIKVAK